MPSTSEGKRTRDLRDWGNDMNLGMKARLKVTIRVLTAWRKLGCFEYCWRYSCRRKRRVSFISTKSIAALSLFLFFFISFIGRVYLGCFFF